MTNSELYKNILYELGDRYVIGLHETTKFTYKFRKNFDEIYDINDSVINEDKIIDNILKRGLSVPNNVVGLKSTVTFLDKININSFNYSYYQYLANNKVYVLIVAIPKNIEIGEARYSISDMIDNRDITSYPLFNTILPREFIYGYYIKNVSYQENGIDEEDMYYECVMDDNIEFYSNDNFYGYMDVDIQREFWLNYFRDFKIDIDLCSYIDKKRVKR